MERATPTSRVSLMECLASTPQTSPAWERLTPSSQSMTRMVPLFGCEAGATGYQYPTALAADAVGNCYMAGNFEQIIGFGTTNLTSTGSRNNFLAKYNSNGEVEWAQKAGGPGYSEIPAATIDALGNFYVAGYFSSNVTFGASNVTSRGRQDGFVAKFSGNGSLQWIQSSGKLINTVSRRTLRSAPPGRFCIRIFQGERFLRHRPGCKRRGIRRLPCSV